MGVDQRAVLGLNLGHDRSACLVIDGEVRVALAEERLSRLKHDIPPNDRGELYAQFPHRVVDYCLDYAGLRHDQIDVVVAGTTYVLDRATKLRRSLLPEDIRRQCPGLSKSRIEIAWHHLGHAASAAMCSGFESAAVLVVDGGGSIVGWSNDGVASKFERTSIFSYDAGEFVLLRQEVGGPPAYGNSIGDFYQMITNYLGFRSGEEGKTMGLAAFRDMAGELAAQAEWQPLRQFVDAIVVENGRHSVREEFQFAADGGYHPRLVEWFGQPRSASQPDAALDRHLAASAQWALEEALLQLVHATHALTRQTRLCLAGGVALNCVANGRILREGFFGEIFIQPAATDDGTALGNALLGWRMLSADAARWTFREPYLGRPYTPTEVESAIAEHADVLEVEMFDDPAAEVARDIASGAIVGFFQGGSEFGPRALGHRSILCDPRVAGMKDHLNHRVKHREGFRPFAPLVIEEHAAPFFDLADASPYMLLAADVLKPDVVPAITHVDGSARVQTLSADTEPMLYAVLQAFHGITGVPVVLNTSFNVAGEPIVETPGDAIRCFLGTGIDVLYLDGRRISRRQT